MHGLAAQANYMPVVAVASRNPANAATRAKSLNARPCQYDDSPAGASTAIVCTNPQRHLEDARLALHGGARVIVEKPLTRTLAQADELVALAAAHGQRVGYGENMAFAPIVVEATAELASCT